MLVDKFFSEEQIESMLFTKKDSLNRPLYFPIGAIGPGFVVETVEQKQRVTSNAIFASDVLFVAIVMIATLTVFIDGFDIVSVVMTTPFFLIGHGILSYRGVRGLTKSSEQLKHSEAQRVITSLLNWPVLIVTEVSVVVFSIGA